MCKFCDKQDYWEQPIFEGYIGGSVHGGNFTTNALINGETDFKAKVLDYKTIQPEIEISSDMLGRYLWPDEKLPFPFYIKVPIQYCPFCGRRLGFDDVNKAIEFITSRLNIKKECIDVFQSRDKSWTIETNDNAIKQGIKENIIVTEHTLTDAMYEFVYAIEGKG